MDHVRIILTTMLCGVFAGFFIVFLMKTGTRTSDIHTGGMIIAVFSSSFVVAVGILIAKEIRHALT